MNSLKVLFLGSGGKLRLILAGLLFALITDNAVPQVVVWGDNSYGQTNVPVGLTNVAAIAQGNGFNLVSKTDGTITAWGNNSVRQTNVPSGLTSVVAIAAGGAHSLALKADGTVIAWGSNSSGQTNVPAGLADVVAIAAGNAHSLALKANGTMVAWGDNSRRECTVPSGLRNVIAIAAGGIFSAALRADGVAGIVAGVNAPSVFATNAVAIAAGYQHVLGLKTNGTVVVWNLGFGNMSIPNGLTNVVAIAAGAAHSLALKNDGTAVAWGDSTYGQTNVPLGLSNIVAIAGGGSNSMAFVSDGSPFLTKPLVLHQTAFLGATVSLPAIAVGTNPMSYQWSFNGTILPDQTNATLVLGNVQLNQAGTYSVIVSNSLGVAGSSTRLSVVCVWAWGDNAYGHTNVPTVSTNIVAIAAGVGHCLSLNSNGTVVAWGKNATGQTNVPSAATNVVAIAAGNDHSLALRADGIVVGWGLNDYGQVLGFPTPYLPGPPGQRLAPITNGVVTINGQILSSIIAISAGSEHGLALRADGTIVAWGNDDYGQTDVPFYLTNVIAIAAGYYHNLALRSDNTVVSWGDMDTVPAAASNVVAIAAGWGHDLALRADGTVIAWGDNTYGQASVPASATNVISVAAGWHNSLALRADGTVVAWGKRVFGTADTPPGLSNIVSIAVGEEYDLALAGSGQPQFLRQPAAAAVHIGEQTILDAGLIGALPMTLQWYHDGTAISGATNLWLQLSNVQSTNDGVYLLNATNVSGQATGIPVSLTVLSDPSVAAEGLPLYALPGDSVCVPASVSGAQPMSYQWYHDGAMLQDGECISGTTSLTLCLSNAAYQDSGYYALAVINSYGSVTSLVARLAVTPILGWGDDSLGQLDIPSEATNIVTIAAGGDHNLALRNDGTVVAWGDDSFGQTVVPPSASNVVAIAAGGRHSLALVRGGAVLAWGDNTSGQAQVPPSATNAIAVAAGDSHSLALLQDGTVVSWGLNSSGQTNVPASASNVVAITAGDFLSLALRRDGSVVRWGSLGVPASVTNVVAVAAGGDYCTVLGADGTPVVWGDNYYNVLAVPLSATNLAYISAGGDHILTLQAAGAVVAWGGDYDGQAEVPLRATNAVAVGGGGAHSLALIGNGPPVLYVPLSNLTRGPDSFSVSLLAQNGRVFGLQFKNELTDSNWVALPLAAGIGGTLTLTDPTATNSHRFYRVRQR